MRDAFGLIAEGNYSGAARDRATELSSARWLRL
jgi:hypothetical protein